MDRTTLDAAAFTASEADADASGSDGSDGATKGGESGKGGYWEGDGATVMMKMIFSLL